LKPGQSTTVSAAFTMHEGMGGPHLFLVKIKSNDGLEPERTLRIRSDWVR
jgi:hypothetical protein